MLGGGGGISLKSQGQVGEKWGDTVGGGGGVSFKGQGQVGEKSGREGQGQVGEKDGKTKLSGGSGGWGGGVLESQLSK